MKLPKSLPGWGVWAIIIIIACIIAVYVGWSEPTVLLEDGE